MPQGLAWTRGSMGRAVLPGRLGKKVRRTEQGLYCADVVGTTRHARADTVRCLEARRIAIRNYLATGEIGPKATGMPPKQTRFLEFHLNGRCGRSKNVGW